MNKNSSPLITARCWLRQNNYSDVADIFDAYIEYNKSRGSGERRNYWDLLAGREDGECFIRHGFVFPILESVRNARKPNYKASKNAIRRNEIEIVPIPLNQERWKKKV